MWKTVFVLGGTASTKNVENVEYQMCLGIKRHRKAIEQVAKEEGRNASQGDLVFL